MNALVVTLRYLYRIRYWLLIGPLLVTGLVYYFTKGMPTTFEANTTIFTGITSTPDISSETSSKSNQRKYHIEQPFPKRQMKFQFEIVVQTDGFDPSLMV